MLRMRHQSRIVNARHVGCAEPSRQRQRWHFGPALDSRSPSTPP
jgi:hypothetical protein